MFTVFGFFGRVDDSPQAFIFNYGDTNILKISQDKTKSFRELILGKVNILELQHFDFVGKDGPRQILKIRRIVV